VLNAANTITVARILLIPVFVALVFSEIPYGDIMAAGVFIVAAATDKLDGYLARSRNSVSTLGEFLDPLADKLLVAAALITLVGMGRVPAWVAMVILGREIAVSVLRVIGLSQGVSIPAAGLGKAKTLSQIVYIVYCFFPTAEIRDWWGAPIWLHEFITWSLIAVVVTLTLVSGVRYFVSARGVIRAPGAAG
jgi:CDP-diacylglycerol---glycerol-3-phosphate 3-phosphatidyltransferase